ncbi:hypothetical protein K458DRAFT_31981 [Lentithecium fluviatile CBS 122367]|uniref:C2H2-type domain-containing protein n=1 Tax=Lentithecium fluviatile CBS 122367 TaxID=1168545 RepID=A0A6G1J2L7_9PLEO|nr:hypothetical protein K458DRAFT_31981 [Lentithecium fluviatile CBS 122367]
MESFYPDSDGALGGFFELCSCSVDFCAHVLTNPPLHAPITPITPATLLDHPDWPQDWPFDEPEPTPAVPFFTDADRQPLLDANVRRLNDDATTIQPSTVQIHVEGTYNPGDRLRAVSRRSPHKRQAPRPGGGFPCPFDGCGKSYDRSCDLKRHQKTHMDRSERPHKCSVCNDGFLYPKDRDRHQRTHEASSSAQAMLYCQVPGCPKVNGFSRRDNLLRHQRKQHRLVVSS